MLGKRRLAGTGLAAMMVSGLLLAAPQAAFGLSRECRPFTGGFRVTSQQVRWSTVQPFDGVNGTSKPTKVTWTVDRSETREYEVSGEVGFDALFDFLKLNVNGRIMKSWTSSIGESLEATMPPHSSAHGVYQVGMQYASGQQWSCDLHGKRQWRPYKATAPFGHRFVRTR
jgi:hypothetical protein